MKTTSELLKEFLTFCFTEHCPEKALSLVSQDIRRYGLSQDKPTENREQLTAFLASPECRQLTQHRLKLWGEAQLSPETATTDFSLSRDGVSLRCRLTGSARPTEQAQRLFLLHFSFLPAPPAQPADRRRPRRFCAARICFAPEK